MRFALFKKNRLGNFQPDRKAARPLIKRRLVYYCIAVGALTVASVLAVLVVWFVSSKANASRVGLALVVAQLLLTAICFGFFDMGPATIMRRNKFKSKNPKETLRAMHTFYYVLRVSGGYRFLFNLFALAVISAVALSAYLV